jgi:DNA polymerase-1
MCVEDRTGYWTVEDETEIILLLRQVLCHPNAFVVGQNLLYDCQYTWRHWGFVPRVGQDTMVSQHVCFSGLKKSLDFQASMYCESYRYWKNDSKDWDPKMGEDQLWVYNVEDCVRTQECAAVERNLIQKMGLGEVHAFQQRLFWPVLEAMIRGVRIDQAARKSMSEELSVELHKREEFFLFVCGHKLNPRSPKQMMEFFYGDLNLSPIISRKTKNPTLDDEALDKLSKREPLLLPIIRAIAEYRSLGVFQSTFVDAELDEDGRMRCSYNICGTETYRFSSAKNAFNTGTNLQNVPKGIEAKEAEDLSLPNIRKLFIPDDGYTFFDMDLDRADLQVVVWEADDTDLKQMLREGVDIHAQNAKDLNISRQLAKSWVHGTNYGGSPRTMAINCGITVREAEKMRARWFAVHPGIERWHRRVEVQLHSKHYVENRFGYRRHYFDRVEGLLPEALAWIPQSTVACVINRAWLQIYNELPDVQVLLQVHDSLAGQFPKQLESRILPRMRELACISIPYPDPLIIPVGIKTSPFSWGDCR